MKRHKVNWGRGGYFQNFLKGFEIWQCQWVTAGESDASIKYEQSYQTLKDVTGSLLHIVSFSLSPNFLSLC